MTESFSWEADLVARARVNPEAFAALYAHYFPKIRSYVRYRVSHADDADDLTSRVFELVLANLRTYQAHRGSFSAWLFAICRNTVNQFNREDWRRRSQIVEFRPEAAVARDSNPEETLVDVESCSELRQALTRLTARERELIALKFALRLSNRPIAKQTGLTDSNVGVILYRALLKLRQDMVKGG